LAVVRGRFLNSERLMRREEFFSNSPDLGKPAAARKNTDSAKS
jgi:hypothetical protein